MPTARIEDYVFGHGDDELDRLAEQHRVWAGANQQLVARAGFGAGDTVVDLGCGPGASTMDLARAVGPDGRVIAVDLDGERSLPRLRAHAAAAGLGNIETRTADLSSFDLPEGSVDGVYARWVLMYLPEEAALSLARRAATWLRPGGACALAEFCNYRHIHIHPATEHLPAVAESLISAVAGEGGCNPEIGNLIPGVLDASGLDVEVHVVTKVVRATTEEWGWPDALFRQHLPRLVDGGSLERRVADAFLAEWEERSLDPQALFFGSPMMETVGRRPKA